MIYEQLCRAGRRVPLMERLVASRENHDLERATRFLRPMMEVDPEGVYGAAYLMSLVIPVLVALPLMFLLGLNVLIAVPVAAVAGLFAYYAVLAYPVSVMNSYRVQLSDVSDIVFEQFVLVFKAGGTIFDAIELVASSGYPVVSQAFQKMLADIADGTPPETCIREFALAQPSRDMRRYLTAVLAALERDTDLLQLLAGESFEADMTLRQKNLELESRLMVVAALNTYTPLMLVLALALQGLASSPFVVAALPFFLVMGHLLRTRFSRAFTTYFDLPRDTGIVPPTQRDLMAEYDEFLNFLMLVGERLRLGDVLEVALLEVRDMVAPEVRRLIDPAIKAVHVDGLSLHEAIETAADRALGRRVAHLLRLLESLVEESAMDAGDSIVRIATRLIKRSALARERDTIISAQRLKVHVLTLTSAAVLGMMASLAPFLDIGSMLAAGPTWTPTTVGLADLFPLFVTLLVTVAVNGFQNARMVGSTRSGLVAVSCALLFWTAFVIASSALGIRLY